MYYGCWNIWMCRMVERRGNRRKCLAS
jgi:hypothetical protein